MTLTSGRTGSPPVLPGPLAPWRPTARDPWDRDKAAHLLRRAGFGASPQELDAAVALGMDRTVDLLLTTDARGIQATGAVLLPHGEVLYISKSRFYQKAQWLYEAIHTQYPLKEKMALFWADHFSVGLKTVQYTPLLVSHVNIFRRVGLGSFRDVLIEVTKDPAMLVWLDNAMNSPPSFNENYARELMELYTMGAQSGYTQQDVREAAKCLSGWQIEHALGNVFTFRAVEHAQGPKTVLGTVISNGNTGLQGMQDGYDLIDVLLARPETAEFVTRKIWRFFVSEDAPDALVRQLAARWRSDGYDVTSLMSIILRSRHFYSSDAMRTLVKDPMEFIVGAIRATGTRLTNYVILGNWLVAMGMPVMDYPDPSGLPRGLPWVDSQRILTRMNFASEMTQVDNTSGIGPVFDPWREIRRLGLKTADQIVDHYVGLLLDGSEAASIRNELLYFMNHDDSGPVPFQLTPERVEMKVRGLVHVIMSMPQYQVN